MGTDDDDTGTRGSKGDVVEPRPQLLHSLVSILQVEEEQVERALGEKALVSGVVLFLATKIPDAEVEGSLPHTRAVPPLTHVHTNCRFVSILFPLKASYERGLASIGVANEHELHAVEAPRTSQLTVEVADAISTLPLEVFRRIVEVLETVQVEVREIGEASHLSRQRQDVRIIAEIERVESGE